ncbi:O-antigen ligase domain-containing protein [Mariprofundus sp. EBB-1]|uniref:O-antigen ligase family protein n=1 Tax=Mariprofundus sp. EBB-1 TaxID=2650971 RepID=UPI000EF1D147|nr:O-antigen ligase family protein [Mariprofundus sp. EBB-1]RLL55896.1 O-antigen ligase domain-containing protein [Mariprofundus sp. EBB-1]
MMQQSMALERLNTLLFFAYAALFIWLPIPLGSKFPWAISVMEIWIYLLTIATLLMITTGSMKLPTTISQSRLPVVLLLLSTLWIGFQCLNLPENILSLLSPEAYKLHQQNNSGSMSISLDPMITWLQFHKALALFLLFTLTLILVNTHKRLRLFAYSILLSALIQAVTAILLILSNYQFQINQYTYSMANALLLIPTGRATGFHSNPDHLAGLMEMSLAIGIGLLIALLHRHHFNNWRQRILHYTETVLGPKARIRLLLIILCIALVMTHSRMGNTAFFASLVIAGIAFIALSRHASKSVIIFLSSLIILDILIIGSWFGFSKVVDRIEQTSVISEASRGDVYADTLTMTESFRWSGIGAGNYFSAFPAYKVEGPSYYVDHVHNDYLEFLLELGVIGTAPLLCLLLIFYTLIAINLIKRRNALILGMNFAALMGVTSILIHSTVDFNLQVPSNAALFTALMAIPFVTKQIKTH